MIMIIIMTMEMMMIRRTVGVVRPTSRCLAAGAQCAQSQVSSSDHIGPRHHDQDDENHHDDDGDNDDSNEEDGW